VLYGDRLFHYSQRVYRDNTRMNTPRANWCRICSSGGMWWSGGQRFSFGLVTVLTVVLAAFSIPSGKCQDDSCNGATTAASIHVLTNSFIIVSVI